MSTNPIVPKGPEKPIVEKPTSPPLPLEPPLPLSEEDLEVIDKVFDGTSDEDIDGLNTVIQLFE